MSCSYRGRKISPKRNEKKKKCFMKLTFCNVYFTGLIFRDAFIKKKKCKKNTICTKYNN